MGAKARQSMSTRPGTTMYLHSHRLGTCVAGEVGTEQHGPQASLIILELNRAWKGSPHRLLPCWPADPIQSNTFTVFSRLELEAGAEDWSWNDVREKHYYLVGAGDRS